MIHPADPPPPGRGETARQFILPTLALLLGLIMAARTWLS